MTSLLASRVPAWGLPPALGTDRIARPSRHAAPCPPGAGRLRLTATDVMTVSEVSDLLHVPVSTIADWGRRGLLPSVKIGRRRLYIRPKIEAQLLDGPEPQGLR